MRPVISIVIPVYNSEDCLEELDRLIQKALGQTPYELILVNDRSTDWSWEKITVICSKNDHAVGVSLRKNSGQDNAIMAGLKLAGGEYVVIMDDDLQHDPEDIIKLYQKCSEGYDLCYAFFSEKSQRGWKNFGSWMNGKLSEKLLSKPAEIYLSPFKIFRGEIVGEMAKYTGPYPYIDALLLSITQNITQIPTRHYSRFRGKSNFSLKKSLSVFLNHATGYSTFPLRLAIYLGFASASVSFLTAVYFLVDYLRRGEQVQGWISTILVLLFLGGITLISLGIIGEYIGRIFLTINNKPQFSIEKIIRHAAAKDKEEQK